MRGFLRILQVLRSGPRVAVRIAGSYVGSKYLMMECIMLSAPENKYIYTYLFIFRSTKAAIVF